MYMYIYVYIYLILYTCIMYNNVYKLYTCISHIVSEYSPGFLDYKSVLL